MSNVCRPVTVNLKTILKQISNFIVVVLHKICNVELVGQHIATAPASLGSKSLLDIRPIGKEPYYEQILLLCLIPIEIFVNIAKVIAQWWDITFEPHVIGIISGECVGHLLPVVTDNVGSKTCFNTDNTSSITFIDQANTRLNCSPHNVLNCKRKESLKKILENKTIPYLLVMTPSCSEPPSLFPV